jgi:hypothetical protein
VISRLLSDPPKLLKWLDDSNLAPFERSWAAEDAFKAGIGWIEVPDAGAGGPCGEPELVA